MLEKLKKKKFLQSKKFCFHCVKIRHNNVIFQNAIKNSTMGEKA